MSVRDGWVDIDPASADHIVTAFERSHGCGEHDGAGTGHTLRPRPLERHDSDLEVASEPDIGSTDPGTVPAGERDD